MFHKNFQFPIEITRPEYKVLEEFLDEGEPIVNPYEIALLYQMQEESQQGLEIDPYFPKSKTQNTHKMAEWSVIGTQMHYVQHPHVQEGLLLNQCEEKIESQIVGKMEHPNLLSLEGESKQMKMYSLIDLMVWLITCMLLRNLLIQEIFQLLILVWTICH